MLFALIFVFQCDHQDCGKDFHKRNQLKTHKCEHQQLLPYQWVATHVMQPTFSLICTWPAKILTFFLFKFLYIVVPSVAVQENFPLMENWSIMRECMEVCWQQENLFLLIGVFNLGGKKPCLCCRIPLWEWRVSFSGKDVDRISEAQKRT